MARGKGAQPSSGIVEIGVGYMQRFFRISVDLLPHLMYNERTNRKKEGVRLKKLLFTILILLCLIAVWMVVTGFSVQTSAYITDNFTVSEYGSEITFTIGVGSSMGYVRGYKDEGGGANPHYLKFYSAWGGFNSSIGAKSSFSLPLQPGDTEIYVYHGQAGYALTLKKDAATGEWYRVK